jgi:DNA-binding response OmpR family regulator
VSEAEFGPKGAVGPRPTIVLLCHDPKAPRIVEAMQVLREIAEVVVASGDDAAGAIAQVDADLVVADEWIGTRDGRTLLAWACQTRASAVGILLASSQGEAAAARFDGLVVCRSSSIRRR